MSGLQLMIPPFVACMVLVAMLSYLGLHVIAREVIFVDLSLAQMAALGSLTALLIHVEADSTWAYVFALVATALGALLFALTRTSHREGRRVPQEAFIGIVYVMASAAAVLVANRVPGGGEAIEKTLTGSILWVTFKPTILKLALAYAALGVFHYALRLRFLTISFHPEEAERVVEHTQRGIREGELQDRGLERDPEDTAGERLLNRLPAARHLVRHEHGCGGGYDVHDADERLLRHSPPFGMRRAREGEEQGAHRGSHERERVGPGRVGLHMDEQRRQAPQRRHLSEREIDEDHFARNHVQPQVRQHGDEHHAGHERRNHQLQTTHHTLRASVGRGAATAERAGELRDPQVHEIEVAVYAGGAVRVGWYDHRLRSGPLRHFQDLTPVVVVRGG